MPAEARARPVAFLIGLLGLMAALFALWPVYRAFLNIEIDLNEGWNAYFADAAMGRMPLYPPRDRLITNNYPPLSFYLTGALGRLLGDPILAGRLLSLAAVAASAAGVYLGVRQLGGSAAAAGVGALYFVATLCRFFTDYVGMNDPHLLAQAVMTLGFVAFLRSTARDGGYALPLLVMIAAGFIKHNLIVMPLVAAVWLGVYRPRRLVGVGLVALGTLTAGFALCFAAFGPDFFANLTSERGFAWKHAYGAVGHLQWVAVGLAAWLYVGVARRDDPGVNLCSLLIGLGLVAFFLQKAGEGVAYNAQFELILGVSLAVGLAFAQAPLLPLARRWSPHRLQCLLLLVLLLRLAASTRLQPMRLLVDRSFHDEIATREAAMRDTVDRIHSTPGDVFSCSFACYRAGKPFVVDSFNCQQRIHAGRLAPDAIHQLVANGALVDVKANPLLSWGTPLEEATHP